MNARTLALRLACLVPEDQEWVLSQLPNESRELLQGLRDEVISLGLNADPSVLAQLQSVQHEREFSESEQHRSLEVVEPVQALPSFWQSILEQKTELSALQPLNGLPPAMEKGLYRYAETLNQKQGLNLNEQRT